MFYKLLQGPLPLPELNNVPLPGNYGPQPNSISSGIGNGATEGGHCFVDTESLNQASQTDATPDADGFD